MSLVIIHFTDIHMTSSLSDNVLYHRKEKLANACNSIINNGDDVLIVISGDIAYSGQDNEYENFNKILDYICHIIKQETNTVTNIVSVPGNHDCMLPNNTINSRKHIIDKAITEQFVIDNETIRDLILAQTNYFAFEQRFGQKRLNELVESKEFDFKCGKVRVNLINSAWDSQRYEQPASLFFPTNKLDCLNKENTDFSITVFHHPSNWFHPDNKVDFNKKIRESTDLLILGHEHRADSLDVSGDLWHFIEKHGIELQNNDNSKTGFAAYIFPDSLDSITSIEFNWNSKKNTYRKIYDKTILFNRNIPFCDLIFYPNQDTQNWLEDIEIPIKHYRVENVSLSDIYCLPELERIDVKSSIDLISEISFDVYKDIFDNDLTLILGDTLSGKTCLAKAIYKRCLSDKINCLFVSADDITTFMSRGIKRIILKKFENQYNDNLLDDYEQLTKSKKCLIIDDFQNLRFVGDKRNSILSYFCSKFSHVVLLSNINFDSALFLSTCSEIGIQKHATYQILPMRNVKRYELVKKWYSLGEEYAQPTDDIAARINEAILTINNVIGKNNNFIPTYPIYLFTILQTKDSSIIQNNQISQYGFLYEMLIKRSMSNIEGIKPEGINLYISILSEIAFKMLLKKTRAFENNDIINVVNTFNSEKKVMIDGMYLINSMLDVNILSKDIYDKYRFKYPYIFYYFVGKYISMHIDNSQVKKQIEYMSQNLHNDAYGNIMIFVCHFANNDKIIDEVLLNAYCTFDDVLPFNFSDRTNMLEDVNKLIEQVLSSSYIGNENDVAREKEKLLEKHDNLGYQDGTIIEDPTENLEDDSEQEEKITKVFAALKTISVLGQIIKNYPGDISGERKVEIIKETHNLGMRIVKLLVDVCGFLEEDMIRYCADKIHKENPNMSRLSIIADIKNMFSTLLAGTILSMIKIISNSFSSEYSIIPAKEAIDGEISGKLVIFNMELNCLAKKSAINNVIDYHNQLNKSNLSLADNVLKYVVSDYLKYNECGNVNRDRLCSIFKFNKNETLTSVARKKDDIKPIKI